VRFPSSVIAMTLPGQGLNGDIAGIIELRASLL
jgi:hypothetical protein